MLQSFVFVMSLSGSVVFLFYWISYFFMKKYCQPGLRYFILKLSMLFYLIPFPCCKFEIYNLIFLFYPNFKLEENGEKLFYLNDVCFYNDDNRFYSELTRRIYMISAICVAISVYLLIRKFCQYYKMKREYIHQAESQPILFFEKEKTDVGLKRDVVFYYSEFCDVPFTIGILKPVLVLPNFEEKNYTLFSLIVQHEFIHIKNHDAFFKFMGLVVVALHWYNPLSYLLYHEMQIVCEICCDTEVIKKLSLKEQKQYYELLIDLSSIAQEKKSNSFALCFRYYKFQMTKRRIQEMRYLNQKKKPFLTVFVTIVACFLGTMTAFAYQPPIEIELSEWEIGETVDSFSVLPKGEALSNSAIEPVLYDSFVIREDGTMIECEEADEKALCSHLSSSEVNYNNHITKSDGSCMMNYYLAEQCKSCKKIFNKTLIEQRIFPVCPH